MSEKPLIFISCGQYTQAEKQLGADVCALLRELRPDVEPYFAENQSDAEGLSNHILKALFRSAGFICIMHERGELKTPDDKRIIRGSLWIEQEIALTTMMNVCLDRSIPVLFYCQPDITLEGIRSVLLLNPRVRFIQESQILDDLRQILPQTVFNSYAEYEITADIQHRHANIHPSRHDYVLIADVKNIGKQRVTDFEMRLFFPRAFLNSNTTWGSESEIRSTPTHICFSADETRAPKGLYPGDGMHNPLTINYFVDTKLFEDEQVMQSKITIELFSGSMMPKRQVIPISKFHCF